jgi:hypothetical protein
MIIDNISIMCINASEDQRDRMKREGGGVWRERDHGEKGRRVSQRR